MENCYSWLKFKIELALNDEDYNNVDTVAKDGWYRIYTNSMYSVDEIEVELPKLSDEFNVDLSWSTSQLSLAIKKR